MIASFSRALVQDLRVSMSDAEFEAALAQSIDEIHRASTVKTWLMLNLRARALDAAIILVQLQRG
jgi:nitrate/nitrite-specific signal transduction histidine kinase